MNFWTFFNILFALISISFCTKILQNFNSKKISSISSSISDIIDEFFIKNQIQFDVIIGQGQSSSIYEKILAEIRELNSYRLWSWKLEMNEKFGILSSSIILLDSCVDYLNLHLATSLENRFPKVLKFLIYIQNCQLNDFKLDLKVLIKNIKLSFMASEMEIFEFIAINDVDQVHLVTIEWFTVTACNEPQLNVLNSFNKSTQKWQKKLKNYKKFQNFHDCELKLELIESESPICWGSKKPKSSTETYGIIPEIFFEIASKKLKFQGTINVGHKMDADVYIDVRRLLASIEGWLHMTTTFLEIRDIIITTPGELYTSYEKLLLPFDFWTWNLLQVTFLLTFIGIFIVHRMPKFIQKRIFGERIKSPTFNVVSIFFGMAQSKLPQNYTSRLILLIFIFFCLIFRTCYQSKLFEFMTSAPRRPPPRTVGDLKHKDYVVLTHLPQYYVNSLIEDDKSNW